MNPITHLLLSWHIADAVAEDSRDRALLAWAGLTPDSDGLPLIVDVGNRILGRPESFWYGTYHHVLFHGLLGAVLTSTTVALVSNRKLRTSLVAVLVFHIHLLCDLIGSRGPTADDIWPIHYLAPFSQALTFAWRYQWPVNAWPNVLVTLLLLGWVFVRAVAVGYSPVGLFSTAADQAFVSTVRARWARITGTHSA